MKTAVDRIVEAFQTLTPASVETLDTLYTHDARFKDPFNDVRGLAEIQRIFRHMYVNLENPRFIITERIVQDAQCFLTWEFHFAFRRFKQGQAQCILGGSHLVLNDNGCITLHRDYWDAAEELYEKLPLVGSLMRWMKRRSNTSV
jgi:steroid Delta-isomerase